MLLLHDVQFICKNGFIDDNLGHFHLSVRVTEYYRKQKELLEGFREMEGMTETGGCPGSLTEVG